MSSIASAALSTGSARTIRNAVTNVIQTKSGSRRMVRPGARRVITVAMMLMAPATDPMPEDQKRQRPVVGPARSN